MNKEVLDAINTARLMPFMLLVKGECGMAGPAMTTSTKQFLCLMLRLL